MRNWCLRISGVVLVCAAFLAPSARANDVDGPDDCARIYDDFGDAPECIPAYPSGVVGKFPTCISSCAVNGNRGIFCAPISTAPGPTGFVVHHAQEHSYWLGCYSLPGGFSGVDRDPDGKTNVGGVGVSACSGLATDCVETAFGGMTFDQDECTGDNSDAGVNAAITFTACEMSSVNFLAWNCASSPRTVYLNICADWNEDADWNDNFQCGQGGGGLQGANGAQAAGCSYEWAVKNAQISLAPGCSPITSPAFLAGPFAGHSWVRISVSDNPAPDDYPWNGSVSIGGFQNGETEDYPAEISEQPTPARHGTWGQLKIMYR